MARDVYKGFNFLVEIDGITQAGFQEASGLDSTVALIEYREGSDKSSVRKLGGLNSFSAISLKRGVTDSTDLYQWHLNTVNGPTPDRRNGSIVLLDETGAEKIRWNFHLAWPSKWTGPSFNATSNSVAIESLEIQHEDLQRA
jgi:phage tail-like protein